MPRYYPIYLDVTGKRCVIIGGGEVAYRKACGLRDADAEVIVVSPMFCDKFASEHDLNLRLRKKEYEETDIDGAIIVIAATDDPKINKRIYDDALMKNILVNVVDQPDLCTFIVPSLIRQGDLCISISSGGASPALVRNIRRSLEEQFGPEYASFTEILARMRRFALTMISDEKKRRNALNLLAEDKFLQMIKKDGVKKAEDEMREAIILFT